MSNTSSCVGCKYLYAEGSGYSNYTWMDTFVRCAKDKNPNLLNDIQKPYNWIPNSGEDKWEATMNSRCSEFSPGHFFTADPDRENRLSDELNDQEQITAIHEHNKSIPI